MRSDQLTYRRASDLHIGLLMIEALNQSGECLLGLIYHEENGRIEFAFADAGERVELRQFRSILNELEHRLRSWLSTIDP